MDRAEGAGRSDGVLDGSDSRASRARTKAGAERPLPRALSALADRPSGRAPAARVRTHEARAGRGGAGERED